MFDISLKNFSLFKKETKFNLKALTILVGGNGSGKSSFLKSIELISKGGHLRMAKNYKLDGFQNHANDPSKPIEILYSVSTNLFQQILIEPVSDYLNNTNIEGAVNEEELLYTDNHNNIVLKISISPNNGDIIGKKITINFNALYNILGINGYVDELNHLKSIGFPAENTIEYKNYYTEIMDAVISKYDNVFDWLKRADIFYDFFLKSAETELTIKKENLNNLLFKLFSFETKMKTPSVIKLEDINRDKIISENDAFAEKIHFYHSQKILNSTEFVDKWIKVFFGENSKLEVIQLLPESSDFCLKLNDRYFSEHGTGTFQVLQLIIELFFRLDDFKIV